MPEFYHTHRPAWSTEALCILCHAPYVPSAPLCPSPKCEARRAVAETRR